MLYGRFCLQLYFYVKIFFFFPSSIRIRCLDEKTVEERAHSFKHLSKSASELDSRENYTNLPQPSPSPQRSGRTVAGVLQRTHGFLSTLKVTILHLRETTRYRSIESRN